jgi:hypothetical protein
LKLVFGKERVFSNIDIYNSKDKAGEIDVLVVFADRAIILQAKSKKLTISSRKGNDNSLQSDFKKAIQAAYDQAFSCAELLNDKKNKLVDKNGKELNINREYKEIYPFCVISEHYPALSFQTRQFLKIHEAENIKSPFVMDVFLLDVMTEMLQSPLHFLSYINRRTSYGDKIFSSHELTILSYHLKKNLWVDDEDKMTFLYDDICVDLDLAMLVRRDGTPGSDTPEGILTKYKGTIFDQIIRVIDKFEHSATISLGFTLLSLSGDVIKGINNGISELIKRSRKDGQHHDLTLMINMIKEIGGLTIHCNDDHESISSPRLENHCELKKYQQKANLWFGICIGQKVPRLRFGINKEYDWVQSNEMDELVKNLPTSQNLKGKNKINFASATRQSKKIGRNEKCPCGSGKKYKNCCLKPEWRM